MHLTLIFYYKIYRVKNEKKEIGKQLHFVLFFFMEGTALGNSENILRLLNESDYPVYFIINKSVDRSWKKRKEKGKEKVIGRSQDIKAKINFLKQNQCEKLAKEDNFIQVNIKSNYGQPFYGVDDIFKKIEAYIYHKKLLNNDYLKQMNQFQDNYRLSEFPVINKNIDKAQIKKDIQDFCNKLTEENILFRKINLDNIKDHGRKIADDYEKNIILLSKLKNIFPEKLYNLPTISFLQAYMIKEIGGGYGFDFDSVSFCFKKFDKDINNIKELNFIKNEKENRINPINNEKIEYNPEELNSKINSMYESSNPEVIERLVKRIHEVTSRINNNQKDENEVNIENIRAIRCLCQKYFEEELDDTYGLPFFIYYYKKNLSLMEDIKYYTEKKDWEKDEIEIIKK